jgi:heat shock protein HspQ
MVDPRLVPGTNIETLAIRLMNKSECSRQFGSLSTTTRIPGVVIEVVRRPNNDNTRHTTMVVVDYEFNIGDIRRKEVPLRNVLMPEVIAEVVAEVVTEEMELDDNNIQAMELVTEPMDNNINSYLSDMNITNDNNDINIDNNNITNINPVNLALNDNNNVEEGVQVGATTATTTPTTPERRVTRRMDSPARVNVVASPHGEDWHFEPPLTYHELNGRHHYRSWSVTTSIGETLRAGDNSDERYTRLDIFLLMFPPVHLDLITRITSERLVKKKLDKTSMGEILRFFGTIILTTKYEFTTRASLWSNTRPTMYENAPQFGMKTRFSRKRFNDIWSNIRFSNQPDEKPDTMTSEQYRWLLVDGFVSAFNKYRREKFSPSDYICVDESISRWYGQGGDWINHGLPMYVAIDRKPENGCEIQDACCGRSGVMIQLLIVKTKKEQANQMTLEANENHGTAILKKLVNAWSFSERVVCADSYFASFNAVEHLRRIGLKFVGVVKTATRKFPMHVLQTRRLHDRGDRYALVHKDDDGRPDMFAFVWLDRERRYFISSGPCLVEGEPYRRFRWRQIDDVTTDNPPERIELIVEQPKAAEVYYSVCGKVDQHNRDRQATLGLETKLKTNDWSLRVNLTIFAMIVVDAWKVWAALSNPDNDENPDNVESQKTFYGHLAAELIDNTVDRVGGYASSRQIRSPNDDECIDYDASITPRAGVGAHLTPTKLRLTNKPTHSRQGLCRVCKQKTTLCCSECQDDPSIIDEGWICYTKNKKNCFARHLRDKHNIML